MAITIPSQSPVSSGPTLQGVSPGDAMAPGLALGRVAQSVGKAAKVLAEHDARIQKVQNAADLTEIKTKMKATYADFRLGLAEDHDYKGYSEKWDKELESLQKGIVEGQYSQAVIDEANRQFTAFQGDTRIGVAAAAQNKAVERAKQAYANGFQMAVDAYDPANPSTADFDEHLESQTWMTPEEKESQNELYQERIKRKQTFAEIHEDPRGWLEDNAEQPKEGVALWDASRRRAKARLNELVSEQSLMVINGVLEGNIEIDDIEALTPDLDTVDRLQLRKTLEQRVNAYAQLDVANSEQENRDQFELDKNDPAYKGLLNDLALEAFEAKSSGAPDRNRPKTVGYSRKREIRYQEYRERIEALNLGHTATDNLWQSFLRMKMQDLRADGEDRGWFGLGGRDYSEAEQSFRIEAHKEYQRAIQDIGSWDTIAEDLKADSDRMRKFFISNPDPKEPELRELRESMNIGVFKKAARSNLRVSEPEIESPELVEITSKEEYDALSAGTRFIYNGKEGRK